MSRGFRIACLSVLAGLAAAPAGLLLAAENEGDAEVLASVPPVSALLGQPASSLQAVAERFFEDWRVLQRRYDAPGSPARRERLVSFLQGWNEALESEDLAPLGVEGRIDWLLLRRQIAFRLYRLDQEQRTLEEVSELLPYAGSIWSLHDQRRDMIRVEPAVAAARMETLKRTVTETQAAVGRGLAGQKESDPAGPIVASTPTTAHRAAKVIDTLKDALKKWFEHYNGYDPLFTWWVAEPYRGADKALADYAKFLREKVVGVKEGEDPPIVGDPIGREALMRELELEMIPYSPEELIDIGKRELAWCQVELARAAQELGFANDPMVAIEHVKGCYVEPGQQPALITKLAAEAVAFLEQRDLITVPELAKEVWRLEMMSAERQKVNPFFSGGEVISVSYPTGAMSHEDKLMSMRGNNPHFSRATVQHELIPGHHLQGFMGQRFFPHRQGLGTPFWLEGWALYWELKLWDLGFPASPEDRVGMLFWRAHRCARIVFSLSFHLGQMTPEEAVELLVKQVGHERANAVAEVRRSFEGSYPPLYQAAYLLGGLQIRALAEELVGSGKMAVKAFHDALLIGGPMPVELARARLKGELLGKDFRAGWRFAD